MALDGGSPSAPGTDIVDGLTVDGITDLFWLRSDAGATDHVRVQSDYAGRLIATRAGTVLVTSAPGVITTGGWRYLEVLAVLNDTTGAVTLRVDNAVVATATGLDTRNAGTKTTFDTVRLGTVGASADTCYDDLYIRTGSTAGFVGDHVVPDTPPIVGTAAVTLAPLISNVAGTAPILGTSAVTLAPLTSSAVSVLSFIGTSAGVLLRLRAEAAGTMVERPLYFITPTIADVAYAGEPFKHWNPESRGLNVWMVQDGSYLIDQPANNEGVVKVYYGGHANQITPAEADSLIAAGFGPYISN